MYLVRIVSNQVPDRVVELNALLNIAIRAIRVIAREIDDGGMRRIDSISGLKIVAQLGVGQQ